MVSMKADKPFYKTDLGNMIHGDSLEVLSTWADGSVDLIMTSPPFALLQQKEYGNVHADVYCDWFKPFARQFFRVLKDSGSLVIDIGGTWIDKQPTRSLYHFKLLIMLCEEMGFHLAQDYYWWNPCRLPNPTEWVTVRRIRVTDAVNTVWQWEFPYYVVPQPGYFWDGDQGDLLRKDGGKERQSCHRLKSVSTCLNEKEKNE